jgi:hypothetical protein
MGAFFLGLISLSLYREWSLNLQSETFWIVIGVTECVLPAILCLAAAIQIKYSKRRWATILALCISGLFVAGLCVAPFLMLNAGTITSNLIFIFLLALSLTGSTNYGLLLLITFTRLQRR